MEVYSESLTRKACEDRLTDYLKTSRRRLHEGAELLCECGGCERIIAVPCVRYEATPRHAASQARKKIKRWLGGSLKPSRPLIGREHFRVEVNGGTALATWSTVQCRWACCSASPVTSPPGTSGTPPEESHPRRSVSRVTWSRGPRRRTPRESRWRDARCEA